MPEIKYDLISKQYWHLEYNHLDDIIQKELGLKWYEFLCDDDDHRNDLVVAFHNIDGKLDDYEKRDVASALADTVSQQYLTRKLLNHLVARNFLPKGDYLIAVSY